MHFNKEQEQRPIQQYQITKVYQSISNNKGFPKDINQQIVYSRITNNKGLLKDNKQIKATKG